MYGSVMGLFKKSVVFAKPESVVLPLLSDRKTKFVSSELCGAIWSSGGEWSRNQNPLHYKAIKTIFKEQKVDDFKGTAHLIPDSKTRRIEVVMFGRTIDVLTPESTLEVADRVTEPVPVKCRIQIIGSGQYERCCVTIYHTK